MDRLSTWERMQIIYKHHEPDRVALNEWFWSSTIQRWMSEGLPANMAERYDLSEFLGLDRFVTVEAGIDTSPRYDSYVIEENESYCIKRTPWGGTIKNFKPVSSTPQYIDYIVKDEATWEEAKKRMLPERDRVDWEYLKNNFGKWRAQGAWISICPLFGTELTTTEICRMDTVLLAMIDNPAWVADMLNHECELSLELLEMIWQEGYKFDEVMWYDDMSYKNGMLFSKRIWEQLVKPYQKKVIDWAHSHGIKAYLHTCGNAKAIIPDLVDMGLDSLHPLEVRAGMEPMKIKKEFGQHLVLRGGFDVGNMVDLDAFKKEADEKLPVMMESGGYVFSCDHSVPHDVSLENYKQIIKIVKKLGSYCNK
jgi:uroporphyrinogen decarboxylase